MLLGKGQDCLLPRSRFLEFGIKINSFVIYSFCVLELETLRFSLISHDTPPTSYIIPVFILKSTEYRDRGNRFGAYGPAVRTPRRSFQIINTIVEEIMDENKDILVVLLGVSQVYRRSKMSTQ